MRVPFDRVMNRDACSHPFSGTLPAGGAAAPCHDPFMVPVPGIVAGFRVASLPAIVLSLAAVIFAWHARDVVAEMPV